MNKFIYVFVFVLLISSCKSFDIPRIQSEKLPYKKDLKISVMIGNSFKPMVGVSVQEAGKKTYNLILEPKVKLSFLRASNCHRDWAAHNPVTATGGLFKKITYLYRYEPNPRVENNSCVLLISALDSNGKHQFAAITFREPDETITAKVHCNGTVKDHYGASICQAKAGTTQGIDLFEAVDVRAAQGCPVPTKVGPNKYNYVIQPDLCLYMFRQKDGFFHKHTTFGYKELIKG
jgi:hypothetical protein